MYSNSDRQSLDDMDMPEYRPPANLAEKKEKQSTRSSDRDTVISGLPQFDASGDGQLFQDLTKRNYVITEHDVINIIIAYGSKYCIAIVTEDDDKFELQGFELESFGERAFTFKFEGEYIKMKEIEQNDGGNVFGIAYQDNGQFFVQVVSVQGDDLGLLPVSEVLQIDQESKPITGFWEPLITVSFLPGDNIFVSCYHRMEMKNYMFIFSYKEGQLLSEIISVDIEDCTQTNFPIKSFYSQETK